MTAPRVVGSGVPLFPWPESPHELLALVTGQPAAFRPAVDRLLLAPHAALNAPLAHRFLGAAGKGPARLCLAPSAFTAHLAPLGGLDPVDGGRAFALDAFAWDGPGDPPALDALRADARPVVLQPEVDVEDIRADGLGRPPGLIHLPRTLELGANLHRWPHLLWLLQAWPHARRLEVLGPAETRRGTNLVGNGVRVHRTAHVEHSILEDGVDVDAHATVVGSFLGRGVRLGDHVAVHHSVVGADCHVLADSFLRRTVAMPGSTVSNLDLREVVLGQQSFITSAVIFFCGRPGADAPVGQDPAALEDSGHRELGGATGHRCVLGARAIFEPGRAVPGGAVIVMRPEEGVTQMPVGLAPGTVTAWDAGALVPVATRWPGYRPPELD